MAVDTFLKVTGAPGESQDEKHPDWIEVLSWSGGLTQPTSATASSAGGGTTERVNMHDLVITKHMDKASTKLFQLGASGKHLDTVTLEGCRAGGDKLKYLEIKMEQVVISGYQVSTGSDFPTESVSFNFGKITITYTQQKRADGSGGGNTTGGWDLISNKQI